MNTAKKDKRFSFEFFPPKTATGVEKLRDVRIKLAEKNPAFFSVTYGAGGSTRDGTKNTVTEIKQAGLSVAPHLSYGGDDTEALLELIAYYKSIGIDRIVAFLRTGRETNDRMIRPLPGDERHGHKGF